MTLNDTRIYLTDEKNLGTQMRFKSQFEFQMFRDATKARNNELKQSLIASMLGDR